jgi:hypothetical protein
MHGVRGRTFCVGLRKEGTEKDQNHHESTGLLQNPPPVFDVRKRFMEKWAEGIPVHLCFGEERQK